MSRPAKRPHADHSAVAARLREHPRVWQRICTYRDSQTAKGVAWKIRNAYRSTRYEPAGAFEARAQAYGDDYAVVARWLGAEHEARLLRAASPDTTDTPTRTGGA